MLLARRRHTQECSCAWHHIAMSTYEHSWRHDTILVSAHGCSWVLKSAQTWLLGLRTASEWSKELIDTQVLELTMTKKCWFLKWPPCSIFPKTQSRFDQIIKNGIFLKSTRKWVLKNVQDGISRPLGSRVIQKTKRSRELQDTLYIHEVSLKKSELYDI